MKPNFEDWITIIGLLVVLILFLLSLYQKYTFIGLFKLRPEYVVKLLFLYAINSRGS